MNGLIDTIVELYKAHPVAQSIGFFGMLAYLLSYQTKSTRGILGLQSLSSFLWLIHFTLIGAPAGALLNGLAIPRNLIFANRGRRQWAESIWWPILFSSLYVIAGIWSCICQGEGAISFLSTSAQVLGTFMLRMTNPKTVRWIAIPVSLLWLSYDAISGSIPGTITEICCQISLYIAIFRFRERKPVVEQGSSNE